MPLLPCFAPHTHYRKGQTLASPCDSHTIIMLLYPIFYSPAFLIYTSSLRHLCSPYTTTWPALAFPCVARAIKCPHGHLLLAVLGVNARGEICKATGGRSSALVTSSTHEGLTRSRDGLGVPAKTAPWWTVPCPASCWVRSFVFLLGMDWGRGLVLMHLLETAAGLSRRKDLYSK